MGLLRKLDEGLIAKIAAGEVIERPYSVVKELVENSIDAGARNIQVEVEEGGRKRIAVIDDGCGMTREDALLALERHATSKLSSEEDLFRIQTLGFRGEALPSIAAVSMMTLETKANLELRASSENAGVRIEIEGGKIVKVGSSSLPLGTRITVENLFFNTPARLKFLKSKETEFSHIAGWIEAMALARPDIGFVLSHGGKKELRAHSGVDVRTRISETLGADVAEFLHPVSINRNRMELSGFVSDHRATSTTAKSLFFFVNGRIVRDRTLHHAVLSAYENLLMKHRYPWAVLSLSVPPDFVDVNVHPTKNEVRFANGKLVHELVREGVRAVLQGNFPQEAGASGLTFTGARVAPSTGQAGWSLPLNGASRLVTEEFGAQGVPEFSRQGFPSESPQQDRLMKGDTRVIGQVHGTYLICETEDKLILIDQHAAHERIGFEKLKKQYEDGRIARQQFLIPQNFDLRPSQGEVLKKYLPDLEKVGLEIEFFGGNTFILRSTPVLLGGTDVVSLIEDLIESLQSFEKLTPFEERVHEVLEQMACHRQVRAGDRLSNEEIEALLREMRSTQNSGQCPHGRPSLLEVPFDEIEKWFKRRL